MANNIIIDYLSFTIKNDSEFELVGKALELHQTLVKFCEKHCSPLNQYIGGHLYTKGFHLSNKPTIFQEAFDLILHMCLASTGRKRCVTLRMLNSNKGENSL